MVPHLVLMIGHCLQDTDTSASESALIFQLRKKWLCLQSTYDQQITVYSRQKFTVVLDRISSCPDSIRFCFHVENHCSCLYRPISYLWSVYHCCLSLSSNHHLIRGFSVHGWITSDNKNDQFGDGSNADKMWTS